MYSNNILLQYLHNIIILSFSIIALKKYLKCFADDAYTINYQNE